MMKKALFTFFIVGWAAGMSAQNLISNWNFQYNNLEMNCEGWYNPCGEEVTLSCSENYNCLVAIHDDSPSDIPEDLWSIKIAAGFPEEGYAETYVTGQNGTYVYQFNCWTKALNSTWTGEAILGTGAHHQFVASKSIFSSDVNWSELTFVDTLTTAIDDTITVRLWAGVGDFCTCQSAFDFIELTVIDTLIVTSTDESMFQYESRVFPNPARDFINLELLQSPREMKIWTVYNSAGTIVETLVSNSNSWNIDVTAYSSGMYFFLVQRKDDLGTMAKGKFMKE